MGIGDVFGRYIDAEATEDKGGTNTTIFRSNLSQILLLNYLASSWCAYTVIRVTYRVISLTNSNVPIKILKLVLFWLGFYSKEDLLYPDFNSPFSENHFFSFLRQRRSSRA